MVWDQLCKWTGAAFLSCCEIPMPGSALADAPGPEPCVAASFWDLGVGQGAGKQKCLALGDFGMAFLRPGCATHSALSPCPHAPPRPAAWGRAVWSSLPKTPGSSFWELAALCSFFFPGAGAKQAPPPPLAGLQAFCVGPFSAAAGRRTSRGLEDTQQLAYVSFTHAVNKGMVVASRPTHRTSCSMSCGRAGTPLHQCPASCPMDPLTFSLFMLCRDGREHPGAYKP